MIPVITIDGPSGAGKGTIAQMLALELDWNILDSGALYRTLAYYFDKEDLEPEDLVSNFEKIRKDFIVQSFSGELSALNGLTFQTLWSINFPGCESSAAPTIGNFTGGDLVPDVFTVVYRGTTPTYFDYYQVMIDGLTGEISWIDSIGSMHFSSSSAFDANGDGRDEVLFSVNYISSYFSHQLKMVDFQNDTVMDITSLNAGVNLGCSPLIEDLDEDGLIEFIYTYKYDSLNPSAWNGFYFNRLNTNFSNPYRGVAWGAYMGTSFTGHYTRNLSLCTSLTNMISSWNIIQPSCCLLYTSPSPRD